MRAKFLTAGFIILCLITIADCLHGQTLAEGSVVLELTLQHGDVPPVFEFDICCGVSEQAVPETLNVFSIVNGNLALSYKNAGLPLAYSVSGTIGKWLPAKVIDENCVAESATFSSATVAVTNTTTGVTTVYAGLHGNYLQEVCQFDGEDWSGGGDITLF